MQKSIIMLLALVLTKDTQVEITGDGEDEQQAVDSLVCLIESGFSEG